MNFLTYYHLKLTNINVNYTEKTILTSFGKTHIIVCGNSSKPPLFLIHGLNSGAPFALDRVLFLAKTHQIFAIDILGQPNKSDFIRLNKKENIYGEWLLEIINYFAFKNISLCGISFGAFPILKSLFIEENNVKEVFLISPAGLINGKLIKTIFKFVLPMKRFQKTKNKKYLIECLDQLYDNYDKETFMYLKEVFLHFNIDFSMIPNFKRKDLARLQTPITIIASKKDFFVPAEKLKKRSKKSFTSLKRFIVLQNSKHVADTTTLKTAFKGLD